MSSRRRLDLRTADDDRVIPSDPRLFIERHQGMVYSVALRMTGSPELAEEIAQETFVQALRRQDEFRGQARVSTWLYSIVRNRCIDELRKRPAPVVPLHPGLPSGEPSAERQLGERREAARVQQLLLALPETQREAFVLRHVEGLEYEEIARRCETTVGNVKVRVHRARETLARKLAEEH